MANNNFPRNCSGCGNLENLCICILGRGPVCECDNPRCEESLGICWGEYDAAPGVVHLAATCRTPKHFYKVDVALGQTVWMEIGFSECAMSMQVAGKLMQVKLLPSAAHGAVAQLMKDGHEFSAPILVGEAGMYRGDNAAEYYFYAPVKVMGGGK